MFNNGYQTPYNFMSDPYGNPQYHTQFQGGYMPFGMPPPSSMMHGPATGPAPLAGATHQTSGGSTFFHQGCNIQYTDVKTFTTTIHLHCGGTADGKSSHIGLCPEAGQCQTTTNPHTQTLHYTQTVPGSQHHFNGPPPSYSSVVYSSGPAPDGYQSGYSQPQNYDTPPTPATET